MRVLLLTFAASLAASNPAIGATEVPNPLVRVSIIHSVPSAQIEATEEGGFLWVLADGVHAAENVTVAVQGEEIALTRTGEGEPFAVGPEAYLTVGDGTGSMTIRDVPYGVGWWWEDKQDRQYEGVFRAFAGEDGNVKMVLALPVEEYLRGVVPQEIGPSAPPEALKAQAVAARSETHHALSSGVYAGPGYDICADVDCQVFAGIGRRNPATDAAIRETAGMVLLWDGEALPAYYSSNCGGMTENIADVWSKRDRGIPCWDSTFDGPGEAPADLTTDAAVRQWVTTRPDVYCNPFKYEELPDWTEKNFRWERTFTAEEATELVAKQKDIGRVLAMEPLERGASGRIKKIRFVGENGSVEIWPELAIRRVFESPLRSSAFVVDPAGNPERPDSFTLTGAGYGHGVGMCQTGAMGRALVGQDFRQILGHYYTDAKVGLAPVGE